ncbi:ABC transporter substrate-binding protein [Caballeronia mineralivorans]|uniref:ABC transporter substrate-binding protein n=1 Tax=Caballeronia mineralivorans TaxID=2010198 RepID=UPI00069D8126|nr:extracellular solute-binding protein [Caballeronia mineralivorans]
MAKLKNRLLTWALGTVLATAGLFSGYAHAATQIRVLNWHGYGTDEKFALEMFEKQTGIEVVNDYYSSDQEMRTKLATNPGAYDVVVIGNQTVLAVYQTGLLKKIDPSSIPNMATVQPSMRNSPDLNFNGNLYAVPWVWGINSFAYNTDKVKGNIGSVQAMWDPRFKGRLAMRDDSAFAVNLAALATGQDINNPPDMGKIKAKLLDLKPQVRMFWSSEDEWLKGMAAGNFDIGAIWAGAAARATKRYKLPVKFVIPDEGAIAWLDAMAIPNTSQHPADAAKFINFMLSKEFYVKWDTDIGAAVSANRAAVDALPADAFNRVVMGTPDVQKRLRFVHPVPDARRAQYVELWEQIKTDFAK